MKPIRALLITGGCCHDYDRQKKVLTEGISSRALVEWHVVHEGGTATNSKIPYYENPNWADGFDIVVHNECFADIPDPKWTERVLKPHRAGVPAIVIHCAMHCYRDHTDEWFKFLGVTSHQHGAHYPFEVVNIQPRHPVMQGFGNIWTTPKGELYQIAKVWDSATPLAYAMSRETMKQEPCIWTNQYGKTRVFGTTIGHYTEEMADPVFLNFMTRGLLWATDKLEPAYLQPALKTRTVRVPENLALKKPATASASQAGHDPSHGNDGDEETRWCGPDGNPGHSWQVDLGQPETVTGARIVWEFGGNHYRYRLEGSIDGQSWHTLSNQSSGIVDTQEHLLKFETSKSAAPSVRYVRLTFLGADPGAWGSFLELEVFGTRMIEKTVNSLSETRPKPVGGDGILKDLKVPADFEATVFAAPPNVTYPTCVAADLNGTLFVGVDENGSLDAKPGRGRIVRCVDRDQDGRADQFQTFATVDSPRGLVVDGQTLYVQHPPFVTAFHDDNADGVADRSEPLVTGLGFDLSFRGADHTTNGMHLGIDGWLYIAVGDYGFVQATGRDGQSQQLRGGGIVRVRPDGTELEIVSRGQRNIYDVAIDPRLNLFTRDNTNDGGGWNVRLSHVIPNSQMGYPSLFVNFPEEIVQPLADYGGGSPCGSLFVEDAGLPPPFGNTLYTCDWGRSIVYRHPLMERGAGFVAQQEPFVEIPRPTDMDLDGRSQLFISSWKDGGFNFGRPDVGYVIRLVPRRGIAEPLPVLAEASIDQLCEMLTSAQHVRRVHAQRELLRRNPEPSAIQRLQALAASDAELSVQVAALCTLKQWLGEQSHAYLASLANEGPLQEFALRLLTDRKSQLSKVPVDLLTKATQSPDARVRLQAAVSLGRLGQVDQAESLVSLTVDQDPLVAHAAIRSLVDLRASTVCLSGLRNPDVMPGCLRVLRELHQADVVQGLRAEFQQTQAPALRQGILTALCRLTQREDVWKGDWWTTRPDTSGPYYNPVDWELSGEIRTMLEEVLTGGDPTTVRHLLGELKRHKVDFPAVQSTLVQLTAAEGDFRDQGLRLLATRRDLTGPAAELLSVAALNPAAPKELRVLAARGLAANLPSASTPSASSVVSIARDTYAGLLAASELPEDLQTVVDEFLRDPAQASRAQEIVSWLQSSDPAHRQLAWCVLLHVSELTTGPRDGIERARRTIDAGWQSSERELLNAVARVRAESQALQVRQRLTSQDQEVQRAAQQAAKRLELDQPVDPNQPAVARLSFEDVVAQVKENPGDAKLGARLFARQGCVACHTVSPSETLKGPLLAGISARYRRDELLESILKPSQKIAQGFESQFFVTVDGRVHDGFVVREAADEIELRTSNGAPLTLPKSEVEERGKRTVSMMPEKLVDALTVPQLASLLAYLESLKAN